MLSCQPCRDYSRRVNQASRDSRPGSNRAMNLWSKYRITEPFYDELRSRQGFRCAICGIHEDDLPATLAGRPRKDGKPSAQAFRLVVDHCHGTNTVRGLLCNGCNSALGHFRDNLEALRRALDTSSRGRHRCRPERSPEFPANTRVHQPKSLRTRTVIMVRVRCVPFVPGN
ncbi:endonuclease VII domain-containing protein [Micromonospora sp. NPDC049089]|uniref:endonuclease VII domain-containing protein n=1 Tax=Micromonospora sp. NPDC049089 TaxID=3155496 RepID=UPI0033D0918F